MMETERSIPCKIYLSEEELPQNWYNVRADMVSSVRPFTPSF